MNKGMKMGAIFRPSLLSVLLTGFVLALNAGTARAVDIVNQPPNTGLPSRASQVFPDFAIFSTFEFDDFQTTTAFALTNLTVYGTELGNPAFNVAVTAQIWNGLPGSGAIVLSTMGMEVGMDLLFDFGGQFLPAGSYWLTAFVTRPFVGGGQWFWAENLPVTGSQSFFYNPGGGFGFGTTPIPGSTVFGTPANQAFLLQGIAFVPEPSSVALLAVGGAVGLLFRRWRPRCTTPA
jgi:hypothetical protein